AVVDRAELALLGDPGLGDAAGEGVEAVASAPHLVHLALAAVRLLVALEVAVVAHALALDERRAAARPRPAHGLARCLVDGEEVEAVDDDARQSEPVRALGD